MERTVLFSCCLLLTSTDEQFFFFTIPDCFKKSFINISLTIALWVKFYKPYLDFYSPFGKCYSLRQLRKYARYCSVVSINQYFLQIFLPYVISDFLWLNKTKTSFRKYWCHVCWNWTMLLYCMKSKIYFLIVCQQVKCNLLKV